MKKNVQWDAGKLGLWRLCKECHIPGEKLPYEYNQPTAHMQTTTQIAEYMVYTNYKPHLLKDDVFPIPPPGYEYFEMKVHAME